tara:strand:+ start:2499 stop:3008 length:510 start_codon:yes stop_codon:yes gene_type:complete
MGRKKSLARQKVHDLKEHVKEIIHNVKGIHPAFGKDLTFGQKCADNLSRWAGSWVFILSLIIILIVWIILNVQAVRYHWDPYPFILLNFVLSMIAAFQAPVILMSANRQAERDRINAQYDYAVNRKAEREIKDMQKDFEIVKSLIKEAHVHILKQKPKKRKKRKSSKKK